MDYNTWSTIGHRNGWLGSRLDDPQTSKTATTSLAVRAGSQRAKLLAVYFAEGGSITDESAAISSGLASKHRCCWWKRCSELRQAGFIAATLFTGISSTGTQVQMCYITQAGINAHNIIVQLQSR